MAVDSIGGVIESNTTNLQQTSLTQSDFIKLFLTELQFQDPLEPINNREFLAQMAQFANLEQARISNENTTNLVTMNATLQSLNILGKQVEVRSENGAPAVGVVSTIGFSPAGPSLTIKTADGSLVNDVKLSQIVIVRQ